MANSWNVSLGNLWGGFRVAGKKALPFVSPGEFKISTDGKVSLTARYDPPGSGWRALIAAIVTGIVVALVAQATGTCAGPGWLLWYILIIFIRRRSVTVNLEASETIVSDPVNHRLAFFTSFPEVDSNQWIAFEIKENFDSALQQLRALMSGRVSEGQITRRLRPATVFVMVCIGLTAILIVLSIVIALIYSSTMRR